MNNYKIKLLASAMVLAFGITACDKPVSAEKTGAEIDQAVDKAGVKIDAATNQAGEKLDAASQKLNIEAAKTRLVLEDAAITAKIKTSILAEPGLKSFDIFVNTFDGVVTLTGTLDSQANSDKAQHIAEVATGVKSVNNEIIIK